MAYNKALFDSAKRLRSIEIQEFWEMTAVESVVDLFDNKTIHITAMLGRINVIRYLVEVKGAFVNL